MASFSPAMSEQLRQALNDLARKRGRSLASTTDYAIQALTRLQVALAPAPAPPHPPSS